MRPAEMATAEAASLPATTETMPAQDGPWHRATPFLAIIVPTLNEEAYIAACLQSLIGQWPEQACEILVVDGGSTDRTADIVAGFTARHPMVRLILNPHRIQSAAMNLGARQASPRAAVLIRADAHAVYPGDFVRRCVAELLRTGATSVVVPMRNHARDGKGLQRAIAAAQSSKLGNGGSAHRVGTTSGFVEHGHHAAFDRAFFLSLGGYDESFTHNEDAELDHRASLSSGRIWMCADAPVVYFPRTSLGALARQYMKHGSGRARTLRKHGLRPRPRQMAPVAALLGCAAGLATAPLVPAAAAVTLAYPLACLGWGAVQAMRRGDPWLLASGPAMMAMHLGWALGFLRTVALGQRRPVAVPQLTGLTAAAAHLVERERASTAVSPG